MKIERYDVDGKLTSMVHLAETSLVGFDYGPKSERRLITFGLMRPRTGEFILPPAGGRIEISAEVPA